MKIVENFTGGKTLKRVRYILYDGRYENFRRYSLEDGPISLSFHASVHSIAGIYVGIGEINIIS